MGRAGRALMILALIFAAAWSAACAAQDWIVTNGLAYHFEKGHDYNWLTAGVGFEKTVREKIRVAGGFYLNSNRAWSTYVAAVWLPLEYGNFKAGLLGAAVTGYKATVTPAPAMVLAYEQRNYGFNVVGVPDADGSPAVLWLQFKTKW
jgi:hypothetical protein